MVDLTGWVFVYEGGSVLFGKLHETLVQGSVPGSMGGRQVTLKHIGHHLEPVYVYAVLSRPRMNAANQVVGTESIRALKPLMGFEELRRKDLGLDVHPVPVTSLTEDHRIEMADLVEEYEQGLRQFSVGIVSPGS